MAGKRQRGNSFEYVIKRAGLLPKPITINFTDEKEGDEYVRRLEALLDRGIVPDEFRPKERITALRAVIRAYLLEYPVKKKDSDTLNVLMKEIGDVRPTDVCAAWVDRWIAGMKREKHLAPATIRSKVGALARCCDWAQRKQLIILPDNPLRTLPVGYASYSKEDARYSGEQRRDIERDRRLEPEEELRIRTLLEEGLIQRKQGKVFELSDPPSLRAIFDLALESAMRLSEIFTLTADQVLFVDRTINLDRTKNGDKRQVPLTSVALRVLMDVMAGKGGEDRLFPYWDGTEKGRKMASGLLSRTFLKVFKAAGCEDLHFHDLRHEATSRLFERSALSTEEVMKITGHKTHKMMMRYLKLRGSDLAAKLW